ncbi:MAG TPA: ribbon-helix-helix protein, CopG family [Acidobacteriaceae bacterium]|nr:ribbon-helix-helix protein, CopG family [Acidobacteriaceae bacterium]
MQPAQLDALDRWAERSGVSRAAAIKLAIARLLEKA